MPTSSDAKLRVSVIIAAYNEERHIESCLDTILDQTLSPEAYEVIVVDDGSRDATSILADRERVRVVATSHAGPGLARNAGAGLASAPVLAFLDADQTFDRAFLEELLAPIEKDGAIGSFTREELVGNLDEGWSRFHASFSGLPADRRMPADHGPTSRVFRAIRTDAFRSVGGYDDVGTGEDVTVSTKLGDLATLASGARCYHSNPASPADVFHSARWYGRSNTQKTSRGEYLRLTPPWSLLRSLRHGWRQRSASFVAFLLVNDAGLLVGHLERDLLRRGHAK